MKRQPEPVEIIKKRIEVNPNKDELKVTTNSQEMPKARMSIIPLFESYVIYVKEKYKEEKYMEINAETEKENVVFETYYYTYRVKQIENELYLLKNEEREKEPLKVHELREIVKGMDAYMYIFTKEEYEQAKSNITPGLVKSEEDSKYFYVIQRTVMANSWSKNGVLIKQMKRCDDIRILENTIREMNVLKKLNEEENPYIEKYLGDVIMTTEGCSIFPGMKVEQGWNIRDYLKKMYRKLGDTMYYKKVPFYISDILKGVQYIHSKGYIHFDLKLDNLIYYNRHIKIIDFGFTLEEKELRKVIVQWGTPGYTAPEIHREIPLLVGYGSDIWSLGCVLVTLMGYEVEKEETIDEIEKIGKSTSLFEKEEVKKSENRIKFIVEQMPNFQRYDELTGNKSVMVDMIINLLRIDSRKRTKSEDLRMPNGVCLQ